MDRVIEFVKENKIAIAGVLAAVGIAATAIIVQKGESNPAELYVVAELEPSSES